MNKFLSDMERKFGRYAISNLTIYIIAIYIVGYIIRLMPNGNTILSYITLNPYLILHGQIWRLVSWVLIPPTSLSIWLLITLYFYYFIGTTMERTIGTFRYNVFIFTGMLLMILAAFVSYGWIVLTSGGSGSEVVAYRMMTYSYIFSTYYLQEMVFLSFAITYPQMQVLFMFIIPIKVKYLGIFYAAYMAFEAISNGIISGMVPILIVILFQFINLGLFYISLGRAHHLRPSESRRRNEFKQNVKMAPKGITRHKCAVCGRSETDDPNLEFRFCSKCNGNYEYCQDHLFTHQHIK